jgi:hypothetical protein
VGPGPFLRVASWCPSSALAMRPISNHQRRGAAQTGVAPPFYGSFIYPCILIIWLFGALVHLQRWGLGAIYVYSVHAKLLLLTAAALWWVLTNIRWGGTRVDDTKGLARALAALLGYTALASAISAARFGFNLGYLAFAANAMLFYLVFMLVLLSVPRSYSPHFGQPENRKAADRRARWLLILATPVIALGILQHTFDSPILPAPEDDEDYLRFIAIDFVAGGTRAFSIFTSGWAFGEFVVFVSLLALALWIKTSPPDRLRRTTLLVFWCVTALASYSTLTRSIYLQFIISTLALFVIARFRMSAGRVIALAFLVSAIAVGAVFIVGLTRYLVGDLELADSLSLYSRLLHWLNVYSLISANHVNYFFGTGLIANERYELTRGLLVDNLYLGQILYSGIIGLALFLWAFIELFRFAIRHARNTDDPFWLALAAFYFSVPASGFLTDQHNTPALLAVLVWVASPPFIGIAGKVKARATSRSPQNVSPQLGGHPG